MTDQESLQRAIRENVLIVPYDPAWQSFFEAERSRLKSLFADFQEVEHFGSTAVPGMTAKPVIDLLAAVPSMETADWLVSGLCQNGYVTSAEFNLSLGDRRWLMRHSGGRRTHHLHLVLPNSTHWISSLRFRDMLRSDPTLAADYATAKHTLVGSLASDREAYTVAKGDFIRRALNHASVSSEERR